MAVPARCACGFTKFASRVDKVIDPAATRWRQIPPSGGLGSVAHGATLGAGQVGWGRFTYRVTTGMRSTVCMSCARVRRSIPVGGGTAIAAWTDDTATYALMTDVVELSCMTARYALQHGVVYSAEIEVLEATGGEAAAAPLEVRASPPAGAALATVVFRIPYPDVFAAGLYTATLVDHCLGTTQVLGTAAFGTNLDVYGRAGDVVAVAGDYSTDLIDSSDGTLTTSLELVHGELITLVQVGGDLGGTAEAPFVIALQGRAVQGVTPTGAVKLRWSAANNRWEPR
jgi:hypothetical protein